MSLFQLSKFAVMNSFKITVFIHSFSLLFSQNFNSVPLQGLNSIGIGIFCPRHLEYHLSQRRDSVNIYQINKRNEQCLFTITNFKLSRRVLEGSRGPHITTKKLRLMVIDILISTRFTLFLFSLALSFLSPNCLLSTSSLIPSLLKIFNIWRMLYPAGVVT